MFLRIMRGVEVGGGDLVWSGGDNGDSKEESDVQTVWIVLHKEGTLPRQGNVDLGRFSLVASSSNSSPEKPSVLVLCRQRLGSTTDL